MHSMNLGSCLKTTKSKGLEMLSAFTKAISGKPTPSSLAGYSLTPRAPLSPSGAGRLPMSPPLSPSTPSHSSRRRPRAVGGNIATSMRKFADYGELKKAALMLTAFQLGREEIKQLKVCLCVCLYLCLPVCLSVFVSCVCVCARVLGVHGALSLSSDVLCCAVQ